MVQSIEGEECSQSLPRLLIDGATRGVNNPVLHHRSNVVSKIPTRINGLNGSSNGESVYVLNYDENKATQENCADVLR